MNKQKVTKEQIIVALREVSMNMFFIGSELQAKYPHKPRGAEMIGASEMANEWADEMEKEA